MYSIGLDFGSLFTKISVYKNDILEDLQYGTERTGRTDIPNVINYGEAKKHNILLDLSLYDWIIREPNKPPIYSEIRSKLESDGKELAVVENFLSLLLGQLKDKYRDKGFKTDQAKLGLSLPDEWYEIHNHQPTEWLINILKKLGFDEERIQIQRESTCAAAYFIYRLKQNKNGSPLPVVNVLICDIGGSAGKFYRCKIEEGNTDFHKISIEKKIIDPTLSGKDFDQLLYKLFLKGQPILPPEEFKDFHLVLTEKWKRKIKFPEGNSIKEIKDQAYHEDFRDTQGLIDDKDFRNSRFTDPTLKELWDAFEGKYKTLAGKVQEFNIEHDDHVLLTGGVSNDECVVLTMKETCPQIKEIDKYKFPFHAISRGAALLAGGIVDLVERIDYTLTTTFHSVCDGEIKNISVEVVNPDNAGRNTTVPLDRGMIVTIKENQAKLVMLKQQPGQPEESLCTNETHWPPPVGEYKIAIKINRHNELFLILESTSEKKEVYQYQLSTLEACSHEQQPNQ